MQKADKVILKYNAIIVIVAAIMNNMTIEHLVEHGYSSSSVLVYRSAITFFITVILSIQNGSKILPKNFRQQGLFMINTGISLLLLFQSYVYLEASTVAMIQRLDIPFAIILGFILGKRKRDFKLGVSIFAFCVVLSIFFFAKKINEGPLGLLLAIIAIVMTSYSYILMKKSTNDENNFVIVNTVNVGCVFVGLSSGLIANNLSIIRVADLWIFTIASTCQFLLNYSMTVLLRHHDVERSRRPYLLSVLIILIVEQIWDGRLFNFRHSGVIVLVVAIIYLITINELPFSKKMRFYNKKKSDAIFKEVIEPN